MKHLVRIFVILLLAGICSTHAVNITITTSIATSSITVQNNLLHLNFSQPIQIDSGWIVSSQDTTNKVLVFHAKNKDYVNISKLERGYYRFFAQAGDSCYTQQFSKRNAVITKELDIISEDAVIVAPHKLEFTIREAGNTEPPHVDSLWIVRKNYYCTNPAPVYMRVDAQSGDTIDILPLLGNSENEFQCVVWINGIDYWSNSFYYCGECEAYEHVKASFTNINPHRLIVNISNGENPSPIADSFWVTSKVADYRTLLTSSHLADGDTIDLAPMVGLTENSYLAWLRWGDCVQVYEFRFNGMDFDYCLEAGVWWVKVETDRKVPLLRYYLRDYNNQEIENIHVDSLWVTTFGYQETPQFVCSLQGQPKEDIDISNLENGRFYELYVQTGECVVSMSFQAHTYNMEGVTTPRENMQPAATKVLHDGLILILRGDKTYTITGQEIHP